MTDEQTKSGFPNQAVARAIDEATALSTLVSALAPLQQEARIRLLRTISTFFELSVADVLSGAGGQAQRASSTYLVDGDSRGASNPSFSEDRSISPKAFLIEKRPQSDVERIACLAYYLTHYRGESAFKTLDLSKLNTEAAQIKLSNPTRAVDNATAAHFLLSIGQGKKQLSAIGEVYVQALPDRSAAREAISDLKKRRSRAKPKQTPNDDETFLSESLGEDSVDGGSNGA